MFSVPVALSFYSPLPLAISLRWDRYWSLKVGSCPSFESTIYATLCPCLFCLSFLVCKKSNFIPSEADLFFLSEVEKRNMSVERGSFTDTLHLGLWACPSRPFPTLPMASAWSWLFWTLSWEHVWELCSACLVLSTLDCHTQLGCSPHSPRFWAGPLATFVPHSLQGRWQSTPHAWLWGQRDEASRSTT